MITLINGNIQNASNIFVPNGSISLQLNVDATVIASPHGFVCADIPIVFQFDALGNILPNSPAAAAQIWSNLELNPQNNEGLGTYYLVTLYDQNGAKLNNTPMWWQFVEPNTSTVDISLMTPYSTVGGNVIFYPIPVGGGGTVTSVAFVGDGTVLSSTPSTPVTTAGNVAATLLTQSANLFLAGPTSGPAAAPTFRAIQPSDLPVANIITGTIAANQVAVGTGTGVIGGSNAVTFATSIFSLAATTAANSGANHSAPVLDLNSTYWTGSVSATDTWSVTAAVGASGANPNSTLTVNHSGSSGVISFTVMTDVNFHGSTQVNFLGSSINSFAGSVNNLTSAANASGSHTVYQGNFSGSVVPVGTQATISGFTTPANNGTFYVFASNTTSVTMTNASGVAESAAALFTATFPITANAGQLSFSGHGGSSTFAIGGTVTPIVGLFESNTDGVAIAFAVNGDPFDAGYLQCFQTDASNHGVKFGAIYDGTGANPGSLLWGLSSGGHILNLVMPDLLTGLVCTGTLFTSSSVGTATLRASTGTGSNTLGVSSTGASSSVVFTAPTLIESTTHTPSSAADTGTTGQIAWDASFIYICTASNTWKRVGIATW